mmetsp:Transcript_10620/g.16943  ORF Transcript_10620/g.16943 Transcript_10620/m.16943 type:complete len:517 (+) Transcript_10620:238-1788(+)
MPPSELAMMDFSRNSQGISADNPSARQHGLQGDHSMGNSNSNAANMMMMNSSGVSDQELLRRLQASRGGGLSGMGDGNAFSGSAASGGMFAAQGGGGAGSAGPGGDREEEFLLQLLYARRRRAQEQLQQQNAAAVDGMGGGAVDRSAFADELLRLRQAGNATAATAAMFAGDGSDAMMAQQQALQQQQQQQQLQQFQQAAGVGYGFGGGAGMFPQSMNMNMNMNLASGAGPAFMMPGDQMAGSAAFAGGRVGFDDYLLRTQPHHNSQDMIRAGALDQQRIELSPSRFLALQQQQQQGFAGLGSMGMMDPLGMSGAVGGRSVKDLEKLEKLGMDPSGKQNKKRYHKKKPSDMPRRPLSAYNLFFSEERERILREIDAKEKGEELPKEEEETSGDKKKPKALLRPLLPSEKKRRPHRKTHGKISFRELAQMVGQRWKALPDDKRAYYQELAKEDMARQKKAMEEYYLKQSEKVKGVSDGDDVEVAPNKEDTLETEDKEEASVDAEKNVAPAEATAAEN